MGTVLPGIAKTVFLEYSTVYFEKLKISTMGLGRSEMASLLLDLVLDDYLGDYFRQPNRRSRRATQIRSRMLEDENDTPNGSSFNSKVNRLLEIVKDEKFNRLLNILDRETDGIILSSSNSLNDEQHDQVPSEQQEQQDEAVPTWMQKHYGRKRTLIYHLRKQYLIQFMKQNFHLSKEFRQFLTNYDNYEDNYENGQRAATELLKVYSAGGTDMLTQLKSLGKELLAKLEFLLWLYIAIEERKVDVLVLFKDEITTDRIWKQFEEAYLGSRYRS